MDAELPFSGDFPGTDRCLPVLDAQAPFSLWVCDESGRVRALSPVFLELAGIRLEAGRARGWSARLEDGQARAAEAEWSRCRREGLAWEREFRLCDLEGGPRHVLSRGMPARDAAGRVRAWVGLNLEITGIRESAGEVRRCRERVLLALTTGGDFLYESDPGTGALRWFGPVEDLLGLRKDAFPDTEAAWAAAVHPEDRAAQAEAARGPRGGGEWRVEYRLLRPDGGAVRVLDRGRAVEADGIHPGYRIGIVTEMTAASAAGGPDRRAEERRRAGQRLEVVGRLAGGIAHDFNNLLTAINGFSELLVEGLADETQRAYAQEILRAGERAALITRQLLAFGRRQILAPRVVDLNAMARDMERALPGMLGGGLAVTVRTGSRQALIKADPAQVEQVFVNLGLHAREALPGGGRMAVDIGAAADGDPGAADAGGQAAGDGSVLLTVHEAGGALEEEDRRHIFEPFASAQGRPQGLGLSAVHGIVSQNGGRIAAAAHPGGGIVFRIRWPRWTGEARAEAAREAAARGGPGPEGAAAAATRPLVLVAEDEETTRDMVRDVLEREGFVVLTAASGQEALELLLGALRPPDLLLTDVVMPGMGGLELAGRLPASTPVKVLFMSGFADNPLVRQGVMGAGRAFIRKPFAPGDLVAKVQSVLAVRQAA